MDVTQHLWPGILYAILCGVIIGGERQLRGKPVGIRTSTLICMGTFFFVYLSSQINEGRDSARVLGQIITGVGFLGAGVIMNKEGLVSGVTSAAVVWLLAGIGAAIGFQSYGPAVTMSLVAFAILVGVEYLEKAFKALQKGVHRHRKED